METMSHMDNFMLTLIAMPFTSALLCVVLSLLRFNVWNQIKNSNIRCLLLLYFATMTYNWAMAIVFNYFPVHNTLFQTFSSFAFLILPVFSYHLLFNLTKSERSERFSPYYYGLLILCFMVAMTSFAFSPFIPKSFAQFDGGNRYYHVWMLIFPLRFLLNLLFLVLSYHRLLIYKRKVVDYASDIYRSNLAWMYLYLALSIVFLVFPVIGILLPSDVYFAPVQLLLSALILFFQNVLLIFNVVRGNFIYMNSDENQDVDLTDEPDKSTLHPDDFETYILQHKPYLNPHLKIADLAQMLQTNRSYLSKFINQTYQKNFSQYINQLRLDELQAFLDDPVHACNNYHDLIEKAGFGSYQSYYRAKKMKDTSSS